MKKIFLVKFESILLCFVIIIALLSYLIPALQIDANYLPVWSDEFYYWANAKEFAVNNNLNAVYTYNGKGGELIGADAHGFMYPLFHGIIAKIFGWHHLNLIFTNLAFIGLSCIVVALSPLLKINEKLFFGAMILIYPIGFGFSFSYMQESMHVFFGVLTALSMLSIYQKPSKRNYSLFFIIIIIASLFKPVWVLALTLLFPTLRNKKQIMQLAITILFAFILAFVYMKLFFEYVPNFVTKFTTKLMEFEILEALKILIQHIGKNLALFFSLHNGWSYLALKSILPLTGLLMAFFYYKEKKPLYLSILIFMIAQFVLIFVLYDAFHFREIRLLTPLFYIAALVLAIHLKPSVRILYTLLMLISFAMSPLEAVTNNRDISWEEMKIEQFELQQHIGNTGKDIIIKLNYKPEDYSSDLLKLPFETNDKYKIKYTIPFYQVEHELPDYILDKNRNLKSR